MADHMNSPKIRKAIETAKKYEAEWYANNIKFGEFLETEPAEMTWAWSLTRDSKARENNEMFHYQEEFKRIAVRLVWAYYRERKQLKNHEILAIVNQLFD